jgi:hypothetical protein
MEEVDVDVDPLSLSKRSWQAVSNFAGRLDGIQNEKRPMLIKCINATERRQKLNVSLFCPLRLVRGYQLSLVKNAR